MGRAREQTRRQQEAAQSTTEEIAVILLSGLAVETMVSRIAPLLFPVLPPVLLRLPDLAGDVVEEAAQLMVAGVEEMEVSGEGIIRAAKLDNVLYRALYGMAAARRIGGAVLGAISTTGARDFTAALQQAAAREPRYFATHKDVSKRRISSAKATQGLMELHGEILSWNWGATRTPREPRPTHLAADGANWRPANGAPLSTGSLPSVEKNCSCAAGPPKRGARILR